MNKDSYRKNLWLLWWLRNFAILGQAAAVYFAKYNLQIPLPVNQLWLILSLLGAVNTLTLLRLTFKKNVSELEFFCQLLIDIFALAAVLYFSGGSSNPFSSLFLLQLIIAATTLSPRYTWIIAAVSLMLYTLLMFYKVDMEYIFHHHIGQFFSIHLHGMWISFIILVLLISWFVVRMNNIIKLQDMIIAESEKVASMGALAALAAHELGTPLATISLLAEDIEDKENGKIIREQIQRCKKIISEINLRAGEVKADSGKKMDLKDFIYETVEGWRSTKPSVKFSYKIDAQDDVKIISDYSLAQTITNLLNNAAEASPDFVEMHAFWNSSEFILTITDQGKELTKTELQKLGQPGYSTKPNGMGMGINLAQTVLRRLGGKLSFKKRKTGLVAEVRIPVHNIKI